MGFMGDAAKTAGSMAAGGVIGGPLGKAAGSGLFGGNAPSTPDFNKAASANQTNAFGANSSWTMGPNGPVQSQSFGGPLGGAMQGLEGQFASANANPLDNGQQARTRAEGAIYGQEQSRLDPRFQQQQHDLQTQLANQGLDPNSQAYQAQMGNFGRERNDAYQSAMNNAIMGGGQEAQRQQGMDINSRMAPLAGLQGMQGLTGQGQNPFLPAAIAQYQGDLQKYGIQQQGKNSTMGGLAQMAPLAMMAAG